MFYAWHLTYILNSLCEWENEKNGGENFLNCSIFITVRLHFQLSSFSFMKYTLTFMSYVDENAFVERGRHRHRFRCIHCHSYTLSFVSFGWLVGWFVASSYACAARFKLLNTVWFCVCIQTNNIVDRSLNFPHYCIKTPTNLKPCDPIVISKFVFMVYIKKNLLRKFYFCLHSFHSFLKFIRKQLLYVCHLQKAEKMNKNKLE